MSDLSTTYPKWPGIVAIVAVSLAGAVVVFLAGFAAGRCGARPHMMMPPPAMAMLGGGAPGQCGPQMGHHPGGAFGEKGPQFGPQRGEGPLPAGRGLDKKIDGAPAEPATPPAAIKK